MSHLSKMSGRGSDYIDPETGGFNPRTLPPNVPALETRNGKVKKIAITVGGSTPPQAEPLAQMERAAMFTIRPRADRSPEAKEQRRQRLWE
jgi:hypothetical protein